MAKNSSIVIGHNFLLNHADPPQDQLLTQAETSTTGQPPVIASGALSAEFGWYSHWSNLRVLRYSDFDQYSLFLGRWMARGKSISMTHDRRLVCDLIELARRMPIAPIERTLELSELARLRRLARPKISWQVLMMRAYALVARDNPLLRRVYVGLPRQYYYEHPENVCQLTISREVEGREQLIFARFNQPENYSLAQLQEQFDNYRTLPLDQIKHFRHQVRFANMPRFVRWLGWSLLTHWMPASRAKLMGTFGMSLSGFRDTCGTWHLGPSTTTLGYDQFCSNGNARLTLTFDHRVLDGKPAFDVLESLRSVLRGQMCEELKMMCPQGTRVEHRMNLRIAG